MRNHMSFSSQCIVVECHDTTAKARPSSQFGASGTHTLTVAGITKAGLNFDPDNSVLSNSVTVPIRSCWNARRGVESMNPDKYALTYRKYLS